MPMRTVQVREFREGLAGFLREVEQGAEIMVMARNRPVARLVPPAPSGRRPLGLMRGKIRMADDFDTTPAEIIAAMEGDGSAE
jgi:prevent-host-death family protein